MEKHGCAKLLDDNGLLAQNLLSEINRWIESPEKLEKMRTNLEKVAKPHAGEKIVEEIEHILSEKNVWPK